MVVPTVWGRLQARVRPWTGAYQCGACQCPPSPQRNQLMLQKHCNPQPRCRRLLMCPTQGVLEDIVRLQPCTRRHQNRHRMQVRGFAQTAFTSLSGCAPPLLSIDCQFEECCIVHCVPDRCPSAVCRHVPCMTDVVFSPSCCVLPQVVIPACLTV
jgi:hypothetical protein